jgi:16S rRNA processing protein RimM
MTGAAEPGAPDPGSAPGDPPGEATRLEVGFVAKAHGLRGEVVVELVSNREERVAPGSVLHRHDGGTLEVWASSPFGASGGRRRWIVAFAGVADRAEAERLRATVLFADAIAEPGTLWVHEMIGALVVDRDGRAVGTVAAVEDNPASDLLVLDGGGLVPLRFVTMSEPGRLTVELPDGLLDL